MKGQKVVIVLAGRYAGRKAVIIKVWFKLILFTKYIYILCVSSRMMTVVMNEDMVMLSLLVFLVIHEKSQNEWERKNKHDEIKSNHSLKSLTIII